jgi:hypothetical protein
MNNDLVQNILHRRILQVGQRGIKSRAIFSGGIVFIYWLINELLE